jgi:fermentation-respiration switch protein FrsA (DUF1100 family)
VSSSLETEVIRSVLGVVAIAAALAAAIFIFFGALLWHSQESVVFQPPSPPFPDAQGARRIELRADDGQPLLAYLVGEPSGSGLVLVFHGNADLAAWQIPWARELSRRTGRAVLLAEFRGYAGLPGAPTYAGVRRDARAVYSVARDTLGVPRERIAFYGHSLGSAIATELALETPPEALILISPLTSVRDMARRISPSAVLLFWTGLARVHYDTETLVRSLDVPVSVAHGSRDSVVPVQMGRRVFDAARIQGELLVIESAGHNDLTEEGGERYWGWIGRVLHVASALDRPAY